MTANPPDLKDVHVDRDTEDHLFKEMVHGQRMEHVLLIQAPRGMGKSFLLQKWWDDCEGMLRGKVNMKAMTYSVIEILGELCQHLGSERFDQYYARCQEFARQAGIQIERSTFLNSPIDASLGGPDSEQRKLRRQLLTDAFFADLASLRQEGQPVVLLFDTFEKASDEVKEWISGIFLSRVQRYPWLVVVVAGQETPVLDRDWSRLFLTVSLQKLEKDDVRKFVRRLELSFSEETIDVLYDSTDDGHPLELSTQLGRVLEKRRRQSG